MDGKGIKIKFEADESPIRSALVRVEKSVKSISKELKEVDKLLELDPDNITLLTQKNEQLSEAITRTTKNLQSMESANGDITKGYQKWQQNRQAIEENAIAIDKMTDQLEAAKTEMNSVWSGVGDGSATKEEFEAAAANVANLTKSLEDLKKEQEKIKASDSQAIPEDVYRKYIRDVESLRINLNQLEQQQPANKKSSPKQRNSQIINKHKNRHTEKTASRRKFFEAVKKKC